MEFPIALMLVQDGITNGAIYALLALALVGLIGGLALRRVGSN